MLVTSLSLDRSSLLTLYFPEKTNEYGASVEIADMIDGIIPRDEYSDEMFMLVPTLGMLTNVTHNDDVFEDIISPVVRNSLIQLLRSYLDVFAWSYEDMLDFHPSIYPEWLANVVHVPKNDGKVRVCVDFQYLNKVNGFSGYNQILMAPENMEKTSFITEWGTYCYKVIQFGLKNTKTTYQRKRSGASWVIAAVTSLSGWYMYFDGEANHSRYEISVLLISPYGDHIPRHVPLVFSDLHLATNNIVEYEACILGLETTLKLKIRQMEGDFNDLRYTHLPRTQNQFVDALVWTPHV
ncbi:hypothetical protein AAG906_038860 [Vitis piasezkii]